MVYLNHCLNSKCSDVIDSRDSCKCNYQSDGHSDIPGMYICSTCGSCCSQKVFNNRASIYNGEGRTLPRNLSIQVNENLGHEERGISFCYKCGEQSGNEEGCMTCSQKLHLSK